MLEWILSQADLTLKVIIGIGAVIGLWWKVPFAWGGKKWYAHYKGGRDAWRVAMLEIQKSQNSNLTEQTAAMQHFSIRLENLEKQFRPNGGSALVDKVDKTVSMVEQLVIGQRVTREVLDMIYWESDANGRVTYVSITLCDLLGCDQNQILGNSWVGVVKEEDRRRIIDSWKLSVANASLFKEQFTFKGCNNEEVPVIATARHTKDNDQKLLNSLVRFQPIK